MQNTPAPTARGAAVLALRTEVIVRASRICRLRRNAGRFDLDQGANRQRELYCRAGLERELMAPHEDLPDLETDTAAAETLPDLWGRDAWEPLGSR
jgi:hypothetical protein